MLFFYLYTNNTLIPKIVNKNKKYIVEYQKNLLFEINLSIPKFLKKFCLTIVIMNSLFEKELLQDSYQFLPLKLEH